MAKTLVEWLLFEMSKNGLLPNGIPDEIHKKAKKIERQRIKEAYMFGRFESDELTMQDEYYMNRYYNRVTKKQIK